MRPNNEKMSVLVYRKLHETVTETTEEIARKVLLPPCLIDHISLLPINMT